VLIAPTIAEVIEKRTNGTSNYATPGALNRIWTSADAPSSLTQVEQRWQSKLEDALALKVAPKSLTTSLADLKNQKNALFKECLYLSTAEQDRGCVLGSASPNAKLAVVIGDSTALSMSAAITGALDLNHWRIQILTRAQCPVADVTPVVNGKPDEKCPKYRNRVFARLAELHPDLVFLSEGSVTDNVRPSGVSHLQFWARGYAKSLALLKTVTPQTVAIFEPPRTPAAVSCVRSNGEVRTCFARGNEDQAYLSVTTQIAKRYKVHLVVPAKWLCLKGVCPAIIDNTAVKFDDKHISIDMAKKLAPLLKADLIKARVITE